MEVLLCNNDKETYIETLSQGCNIGTYSALLEEEYSFNCRAKTDWTVMHLKYETLEKYRNKYEELNYYLIEYEGFLEDKGVPYWDFLIYHDRK